MVLATDRSLRRTLPSYFDSYLRSRTHLALGKDAPESRLVQRPELGPVVELPEVGGVSILMIFRCIFLPRKRERLSLRWLDKR